MEKQYRLQQHFLICARALKLVERLWWVRYGLPAMYGTPRSERGIIFSIFEYPALPAPPRSDAEL